MKEGNKLSIETRKNDGQKWRAWIEIHPNKAGQYLCDFKTEEDGIIGIDVIQQYLGAEIIEKIQTQFEDRHSEFGYFDVIHMTKFEFVLNTGIKLEMIIGEIYDIRYPNETRLEHTGADTIFN